MTHEEKADINARALLANRANDFRTAALYAKHLGYSAQFVSMVLSGKRAAPEKMREDAIAALEPREPMLPGMEPRK